MPDQYGRPVIQDWMGIAQSVNAIGDIQDKAVKRERDNKEYERNEKVIDYKTKIASGKLDPAFDATKDIPDVYSTKDALWAEQARASYVQEAAQTEQGKATLNDIRRKETKAEFEEFIGDRALANRYAQQGEKQKAIETIAGRLKKTRNPYSGVSKKDGTMDLYFTEDGEKKFDRNVSLNEALKMMEDINESKFTMLSLADREHSNLKNTEANFNPRILQNEKGEKIEWVVKHLNKTRENDHSFYKNGEILLGKDGKKLTKEDVFKQGFTETTKKEIKADAKEARDEKRLENEDKRLAAADKRNALYEEYTDAKINALEKKANAPPKETATDRKAKEEKALRHLLGSLASDNINLQQDPEGRTGGQVTAKQLKKVEANALKRGFQVYSRQDEDGEHYISDIVKTEDGAQESPAQRLIRMHGKNPKPGVPAPKPKPKPKDSKPDKKKEPLIKIEKLSGVKGYEALKKGVAAIKGAADMTPEQIRILERRKKRNERKASYAKR
jgi:hypothetical protein